jgi:ornithine cyclodeaminase/alanine dehydrogenase-like protein (mu-crystallin family)
MNSSVLYITEQKIHMVSDVVSLAERFKSEFKKGMQGVDVPYRTSILRESPFKAFVVMPAYSNSSDVFITKIGTVLPENNLTNQSVNAIVVAFSGKTGKLIACFDGNAITNIKCAAVTAMVTDICSPPYANVLGIIGCGTQALQQIHGVSAVRELEEVKFYARNIDKLNKFIECNQHLCPSTQFIACNNPDETVEGAQIVSTTTTSIQPVIGANILENQSVHINCMGNHSRESREVPIIVLQKSKLIVEDMATALLEAGDAHKDAITLQQLLVEDVSSLQYQRTVFSSTGHAFLDLITVVYLIEKLNLQ